MERFEYRVVPAPKKGEKAKGAKTTAERFAVALSGVMNTLGQEGWDYVRADTLPCEERVGLTGSKMSFQNMLVFRRALAEGAVTRPQVSAPAPDVAPPLLLPLPPAPPVEMERRADTDGAPLLRAVPSTRGD